LLGSAVYGQAGEEQQNNRGGKYLIDRGSSIEEEVFVDQQTWHVEGLDINQTEEVLKPNDSKVFIPFLGIAFKNRDDKIYQLELTDPLMKYGKSKVLLQEPLATQAPRDKAYSSGYDLTLSPEDIQPFMLNQLPIRPDSIKVSIRAEITDSEWSDLSINYKSQQKSNKSFLREIDISRSVMVKIEPFDWSPVTSIAPMIDWDRTFTITHRYFIAADMDIPYAIVERRDGKYNVAIYEDITKSEAPKNKAGSFIRAVPNPVINDLSIEVNNFPEGAYTLKVKNILGEVKVEKTINFVATDYFPIDISNLRKGSYFYSLEDANGNTISTKRLIIIKP